MLNVKKLKVDYHLKTAFESGYTNATLSLSKIAKQKIYFNNFHVSYYDLGDDFSVEQKLLNRDQKSVLLTTEIFGDLTGKSYLFLSHKEFEYLTSEIPEGNNSALNFKEEFAKELDNILSAAVITKLSNELNVKMYGDVPVLIDGTSAKIEDVINDDFGEYVKQVYINSISFSFDRDMKIAPRFIWVMDSDSLAEVVEKKGL